MKNITFPKSLTAAAVAASLGFPAFAVAQDAADVDVDENVERIQVTGSRIPQSANVVSSSPISQLTSEEFEFSGTVRTEDLINDLPQVFAGQASTDTNGATGTATVSLRKLGPDRTLALINGRRMVMGTPIAGGTAPDLNQIPAALIENVELLTGGASATYGSDAIAGVVNFIMKDDFEGVEFNYQNSFYMHNNNNNGEIAEANREGGYPLAPTNVRDGHMNDYSLIMGTNGANGDANITLYMTHRNIDAVTQDNRDISTCALAGTPGDWGCSGSGTTPQPKIYGDSAIGILEGGEVTDAANVKPYNYGPVNYFQRPDKRTTLGGFAKYYVNEHLEFFAEAGYMKDSSVAQIAESGAFFVDAPFNCNNPLLTDSQFDALCASNGYSADDSFTATYAKRNVEGGPRKNDLSHISHRLVFGARGSINDNWTYDASFNYGNVNMTEVYMNDFSKKALQKALDVVPDPETGEAVCRAALSGVDADCVPYNIYGGPGGNITQEQLDYLTLPLYAKGETSLREFNFYTVGDLTDYGIKSPWSFIGAEALIGYTHRSETLTYSPDSGYLSGDGAGQGGPSSAVDGTLTVDELYSEVRLPLVQDAAWADNLVADLGYRYSDYSTGIDTDTYKVALGWDVNESVKLRGSFQSAVRHANIRDLYLPQGFNLFSMEADKCAGSDPEASLEACQNTGVTPEQYGNILDNPAGQYNYVQGGNPQLQPEASDTISFGFVYRPTSIKGFDFSIDYFDIEVEDAIGIVEPTSTIDSCLATGEAQFCNLINRNANGSLWQGDGNVVATNVNIGYEQRTGYDVNSNYILDLDNDAGQLRFNLVGTYFTAIDSQFVAGEEIYECAGKWGDACGSPAPEWQHNLRMTWVSNSDVNVSLNWRYLGSAEDILGNQDLGAQSYLDLSAQVFAMNGLRFNVGMNNVLDKDAPAIANRISDNGNTFPALYDALGRYVFAGVQYSF